MSLEDNGCERNRDYRDTMSIEIHLTDEDLGKRFVTRKGDIVTLERTPGHSPEYPYSHSNLSIARNGRWMFGQTDEDDIIARLEDAIADGNPPSDSPERRHTIPFDCKSDASEDYVSITDAKAELLSNVKESNPKDAVGIRKVPFSCLSMPVMAEVAVAMLEGARKYGRHNYREIGVRASVYYDACFRHLMASWEGEDADPDSGLDHITKAIATLMVLRDAKMRGKCADDRPHGTAGFVKAVNELASQQCERYPDAKEPFLANGRPPVPYQG